DWLFVFNDTATTEIYTLSLHDALPISPRRVRGHDQEADERQRHSASQAGERSEEHTSELQSHSDLVCPLLLEKKRKNNRHRSVRCVQPTSNESTTTRHTM